MKHKAKTLVKLIGSGLSIIMCLFALITIPVYAWLAASNAVLYAPITTETALFIGAGAEEDIKYLYLEGIDTNKETRYRDYVFSVSGSFVKFYRIQLAYTTNNQFEFELYRAIDEKGGYVIDSENPTVTVDHVGYRLATENDTTATRYTFLAKADNNGTFVKLENETGATVLIKQLDGTYEYFRLATGGDSGQKYTLSATADVIYSSTNKDIYNYHIVGSKIVGNIPNKQENAFLGKTNDGYYSDTYGTYDKVNKYAVPVYWQMQDTVDISSGNVLPHYYILRVLYNDKNENDRETDIVCIAAKDFASSSHSNN